MTINDRPVARKCRGAVFVLGVCWGRYCTMISAPSRWPRAFRSRRRPPSRWSCRRIESPFKNPVALVRQPADTRVPHWRQRVFGQLVRACPKTRLRLFVNPRHSGAALASEGFRTTCEGVVVTSHKLESRSPPLCVRPKLHSATVRLLVLTLGFSLSGSPLCFAQAKSTAPAPLDFALARLKPGARITGRITALDSRRVEIQTSLAKTSVPWSDVESLVRLAVRRSPPPHHRW